MFLFNALLTYSPAALSKVDFSTNLLTDVPTPVWGFSKSLTELVLAYNRIEQIPSAINQLSCLVTLDIRGNRLSTLPPEIGTLFSLQDVVLSMNRFKEVPPILYQLPQLLAIVASDNQIAALDIDSLLKLSKLSVLDVANNSIAQVPPALCMLPELKSLKLEGNVFKIPRPAVLAKGTPAVLDYLRGRMG